MIHISNHPSLSEAFKNEEIQDFFLDYLKKISDGYHLKQFLIDGPEKTFQQQMDQFAKSFVPVITNQPVLNHLDKETYQEVKRCLDGVHFKVGDMVYNKDAKKKEKYPIGRMYADERGLHVQLIVDGKGRIMWSNLGRIEHYKTGMETFKEVFNMTHPAVGKKNRRNQVIYQLNLKIGQKNIKYFNDND